MTKEVIFNAIKVPVKVSAITSIIYQQNFRRNFLTDFSNYCSATAKKAETFSNAGIVFLTEEDKKKMTKDEINEIEVQNAEKLAGIEIPDIDTVTTWKFVWVAAKTANKDIPDFEEWLENKSTFELNSAVSVVANLISEDMKPTQYEPKN